MTGCRGPAGLAERRGRIAPLTTPEPPWALQRSSLTVWRSRLGRGEGGRSSEWPEPKRVVLQPGRGGAGRHHGDARWPARHELSSSCVADVGSSP
jgi:hypothetical protein